MLIRKNWWKGISAIVACVIVGLNPAMAGATGVEEVTVYGSGQSVTEIEEENKEIVIDEEEIWAQVDKDELRSFVDVNSLKETIDKRAILEMIDLDALRAQIDEEKIALEVDNDVHPVDVINIQLPVIEESSPFNFFIDPRHFLYSAYASVEDQKVEEGANILFKNKEGEYAFSSKSDNITVTNRSNIPVRLSIKAQITTQGGVDFVDSRAALDGKTPSVFMAIADKDGIRSVMTENGEVCIDVVLDATPDGTYDFRWNEENGKYEYGITNEDVEFDSYSFYLIADCNTEANWSSVSVAPVIAVSWKTEPVILEEELTEEEQQISSEIDTMVRAYFGMRDIIVDEQLAEVVGENADDELPEEAASDADTIEQESESEETDENVNIEDEAVPEESSVEAALEASSEEDALELETESSEEVNEEVNEDGVAIRKEFVQPEVSHEEIRAGKIKALIYKELLRLATDEYNRIFEEKLNPLIEAEVDKLAEDLFQELREKAINDLLENKYPFEDKEETREDTEDMESQEVLDTEYAGVIEEDEKTEASEDIEEEEADEETEDTETEEESEEDTDLPETEDSGTNTQEGDGEKVVIF